MAIITKEDVLDAIDDKNENVLDMLTEYWQSKNEEEGNEPKRMIANALSCAKMLYSAKAYQETLDWLDSIGLDLSKEHGEESEVYEEFVENEEIENLRMEALDKSAFEEEEEEDFGDDE